MNVTELKLLARQLYDEAVSHSKLDSRAPVATRRRDVMRMRALVAAIETILDKARDEVAEMQVKLDQEVGDPR